MACGRSYLRPAHAAAPSVPAPGPGPSGAPVCRLSPPARPAAATTPSRLAAVLPERSPARRRPRRPSASRAPPALLLRPVVRDAGTPRGDLPSDFPFKAGGSASVRRPAPLARSSRRGRARRARWRLGSGSPDCSRLAARRSPLGPPALLRRRRHARGRALGHLRQDAGVQPAGHVRRRRSRAPLLPARPGECPRGPRPPPSRPLWAPTLARRSAVIRAGLSPGSAACKLEPTHGTLSLSVPLNISFVCLGAQR